jgi:glycerol-3-phosphate dehydrogenase
VHLLRQQAIESAVAAAENAVINGVTLLLDTEFYDFIIEGSELRGVKTSRGDFACKWVVNAAGLHSDELLHKTGDRPEFKITPRRGEYLIFDANKVFLNNVLFPLPTDKGKGTLVTTPTHGNVMIGPNANVVGTKDDDSTTSAGLDEVLESAKHLVPSLSKRDVIAQFAGIRATGNAGHDFVVERSAKVRGVIHLTGIESPGFVSAPAVAKRVVELMTDAGAKLTPKASFDPVRKAPPSFRHLSHKERGELVARDPAYGRIVCRCEEVTEGEIVAAIRSPISAKTYDAIKRRTWRGTARCQGGYD